MDRAVERFEMRINVDAADIDVQGHVNNVVYLRWVQDVAVAHWRAAARPEDQAGLSWVVVRHEIDYKHPALPGDDILARTWVGEASRRSFSRYTELRRASDGRLLAKARTVWCPIDRETGKLTHVSEAVRQRFSASAE